MTAAVPAAAVTDGALPAVVDQAVRQQLAVQTTT